MLDLSRVDLVLQYALLTAGGNDDPFDRGLGPIHLLKYVYLADLFHAEKNVGTTLTKITWRFHKFGPWSQKVHERIEPALEGIGAGKKSFESDYGERRDWVRWSMRDDLLLREIERKLPPVVTQNLRRDIRKFGKDTPELLDYVYRTKPMLHAAPGECLDFALACKEPVETTILKMPLRMESLSNKKRKRFQERMGDLRARHAERRAKRSETIITGTKPSPRYDDVFSDGVAWLDSLAGPEFLKGEQIVKFTPEVWKSEARRGSDED